MKIAKTPKNENLKQKLKMSLGQNMLFGVSGNLAKLVFFKNLAGSFGHPELGRCKFLQPPFASKYCQNSIKFPKICSKSPKFFKKKFFQPEDQAGLPRVSLMGANGVVDFGFVVVLCGVGEI